MTLLQPHYHLNNNKDNPEKNLSEQSVKQHNLSLLFDIILSPSTIAVTRPIDSPFSSVEVQEFIYIHYYQWKDTADFQEGNHPQFNTIIKKVQS